MSNPEQDPSGTTQQFRAFVRQNDTTAATSGSGGGARTGLIIGGVVIALVAVAVISYFML